MKQLQPSGQHQASEFLWFWGFTCIRGYSLELPYCKSKNNYASCQELPLLVRFVVFFSTEGWKRTSSSCSHLNPKGEILDVLVSSSTIPVLPAWLMAVGGMNGKIFSRCMMLGCQGKSTNGRVYSRHKLKLCVPATCSNHRLNTPGHTVVRALLTANLSDPRFPSWHPLLHR